MNGGAWDCVSIRPLRPDLASLTVCNARSGTTTYTSVEQQHPQCRPTGRKHTMIRSTQHAGGSNMAAADFATNGIVRASPELLARTVAAAISPSSCSRAPSDATVEGRAIPWAGSVEELRATLSATEELRTPTPQNWPPTHSCCPPRRAAGLGTNPTDSRSLPSIPAAGLRLRQPGQRAEARRALQLHCGDGGEDAHAAQMVQAGETERKVKEEQGIGGVTLHYLPAPPPSPEENQEEDEEKELRAALIASEAAREEAEACATHAEVAAAMFVAARRRLAEKRAAARAEAVGADMSGGAGAVGEGGGNPGIAAKADTATSQSTEEIIREENDLLMHVSLPPGFPPSTPPLRRLCLFAASGTAAVCAPSASPDAAQHGRWCC